MWYGEEHDDAIIASEKEYARESFERKVREGQHLLQNYLLDKQIPVPNEEKCRECSEVAVWTLWVDPGRFGSHREYYCNKHAGSHPEWGRSDDDYDWQVLSLTDWLKLQPLPSQETSRRLHQKYLELKLA